MDTRKIQEALDGMAKALSESAWDVAVATTCTESDAIARGLVATGNRECAIHWMEAHACKDDPIDDRHADMTRQQIENYIDTL